MRLSHASFSFVLSLLLSWWTAFLFGSPQQDFSEKELKVSLRLIGHQLLLESGNTSSRVLPVEADSNTYLLSFESDFALHPDKLIKIVDSVMSLRKHVDAYIVEAIECNTEEVVYSFAVTGIDSNNLMPCIGRPLEKGCYKILFTLNKIIPEPFTAELAVSDHQETLKKTESSNLSRNGLWLSVIILLLLVYLIYRRASSSNKSEYVISLGKYNFDQQKAELLFDKEKTELSSKEADLLMLLYSSLNQTLERETILNKVWGDEGDYVGRTLDVFISKLRKKLEQDPEIKIVNVRGVGYKMVI